MTGVYTQTKMIMHKMNKKMYKVQQEIPLTLTYSIKKKEHPISPKNCFLNIYLNEKYY